MEERLGFTVHPNILLSIMERQAGTLAKALLEGVMNSVDAGATRVSVKVTTDEFIIQDDGRGFQSREEIINWFGQFGTPHEEGDATYGRFRMGRGQLMAFGVNEWRSGNFCMRVDIRHTGLDYGLQTKSRPFKGCRVKGTLYQALNAGELSDVLQEFSDFVRFCQIPVYLNGRKVSKNIEDVKWDLETPEAFIKVSRTGSLAVYNLGVLVRKFEQYHFGCGGIVVSKQPLMVNFARNDIIAHQCQIWRAIINSITRHSVERVASKAAMSNDERKFLALQWLNGVLEGSHPEALKLFTDATGRHWSLTELKAYANRLSIAPEGKNHVGARLHRDGTAFILSHVTLQRFRTYSLEELLASLEERTGRTLSFDVQSFESLALNCGTTFKPVCDSTLTHNERCVLEALRHKHEQFHAWFSAAERNSGIRSLKAGESDIAEAWTDGEHYIALNRKVLAKAAKKGLPGMLEILLTLVHEYCHDSADYESHEHDVVFYNKHHDVLQYKGGKLVTLANSVWQNCQRRLRSCGALPSPSKHAKATRADIKAEAERLQMKLF